MAERKSRRRAPGIAGAALILCYTMALITGIIWFLAGNAGVMEGEMRRFAPPETTGLPEREYPGMAVHITDYLKGRKDSFQYVLRGTDGAEILCFHDYEQTHMADCRDLILLDGAVFLICAVLGAGSAVVVLRADADGRAASRRGAKRALIALGGIAAALALWAVLDFEGFFTTFHRIAFRNDLWLLNPGTDLLIRLMPEGMFIDLGVKGLTAFAAGMLVPAVRLMTSDRKKNAGERNDVS